MPPFTFIQTVTRTPSRRRAALFAATALAALALSGCFRQSSSDITGSIPKATSVDAAKTAWRQYAEAIGNRYEANPDDISVALKYGHALRQTEQYAQAVAVLQKAAIRAPHNKAVLGEYGRALSDDGQLDQAARVLANANSVTQPDWRLLSAQGIVADRLGKPEDAQNYYKAALKIVPDEPSVLANLGLSYALSKRLPDAERVLRQASANPKADARVRQNLALVLGLEGKFGEAEHVLRQDMSAQDAQATLAYMKGSVSQPNSWKTLQGLDKSQRTQPKKRASAKEPVVLRGVTGDHNG